MKIKQPEGMLVQVRDLRIAKSRALLYDALLMLLDEKEYNDITIKDLSSESGVSRQTFYRIYNNKDEILLQYTDEMFDAFYSKVMGDWKRGKKLESIGTLNFQMWKDNKDHFVALQKAQLTYRILEQFIEYGNIFIEEIRNKKNKDKSFHRYLAYCLGGCTYTMIHGWFLDELKHPVKDLGTILGKFYKIILEETKVYNSHNEPE